jgi:hypothetical protein
VKRKTKDLAEREEQETIHTLRLTDAELEMIGPRARRIIAIGGFAALVHASKVVRVAASLERDLDTTSRFGERNAAREMGVISVESVATTVDDDLAVENARLRGELEDVEERAERLERRNADLVARLAEEASAVNARGTGR